MNDWYRTLQRPPLTPPDWVFGPAWTVLYGLIALSIFIYIRAPKSGNPLPVYLILGVHLATNFVWSYLFFGLRSPLAALADLAVLDLTLVWLIFAFRDASGLAAALLLPYLLWVSFATYLNLMFWKLN
jgi:tryptophan-rich sensory protein